MDLSKSKTPSGAVLRPRRRRNCLMRLCAGSGLIAMLTPVSSVPPLVAPSIPEWGRGVKRQCQAGRVWGSLSRAFALQLPPHRLQGTSSLLLVRGFFLL